MWRRLWVALVLGLLGASASAAYVDVEFASPVQFGMKAFTMLSGAVVLAVATDSKTLVIVQCTGTAELNCTQRATFSFPQQGGSSFELKSMCVVLVLSPVLRVFSPHFSPEGPMWHQTGTALRP